MTRDKVIGIGALLLAGLGFLVLSTSQEGRGAGRPPSTSIDLPAIGAPSDINKISITNGEKGEVVLEKVASPGGADTSADAGPSEVWMVTKPVRALANQVSTKDLVSNLQDLKVDSEVHLTLDDTVRKDKQLDPAHAVHVVAWKGSDKKVDENFGKSGPAGQLVVLGSKPNQVWAAKGYSSYLYTKDVKDFRDKEILKFEDNSVARVTIVNAHGTFSFTKGDKWAATLSKKRSRSSMKRSSRTCFVPGSLSQQTTSRRQVGGRCWVR